MPITPDAPFPKTQGDNIRSKDWNDAITELIRLDNAKANRSGDKFTGPLSVTALGIGSNAPPSGLQVKTLTRIDEGPSGAGAWANIGSNLYFDGAWKQVDPSKAGVSLHINPVICSIRRSEIDLPLGICGQRAAIQEWTIGGGCRGERGWYRPRRQCCARCQRWVRSSSGHPL